MSVSASSDTPIDDTSCSDAWHLLRVLAGREEPTGTGGWTFRSGSGGIVEFSASVGFRSWSCSGVVTEEERRLFDLYVPACAGPGRSEVRAYAIGHLGQSLDGFIAGADGESRSLNARENIVHLHRLRALFDAVLVGRQTASVDDPQLTTRLVPGRNPVRVVLDPGLRCDPGLKLFDDGQAETVILCASDAPQRVYPGATRVWRLRGCWAELTAREALERLRAEGLSRIFIEGGGETVSRALRQGALDRLHLTVAPLFIGSGKAGIALPEISRFGDAVRPPSRHFTMGPDVLFDFELTSVRTGP